MVNVPRRITGYKDILIQDKRCFVPFLNHQHGPPCRSYLNMRIAVESKSIPFSDLPDESCRSIGSCPATTLFTGGNQSFGQSLAENFYTSGFDFNSSDILNTLADFYLYMMMLNEILGKGLTYNALINGYCNDGKTDVAFQIMDSMASSGCKPETRTYNEVIFGTDRSDDGDSGNYSLLFIEEKNSPFFPLFLSDNCSFCAPASDLYGSKGNCIYFTDRILSVVLASSNVDYCNSFLSKNCFDTDSDTDGPEISEIPTLSNVRQDLTEWQERHATLVLLTVKIYVELERARLIKKLAKIKESQGLIALRSADLMQKLQ
ncbi:hypothetical protein IFM89_018324 [Coptis chinensis]|uniref:DUF295 domain-containing protein n=1 Tax=Coptis chinensis TaxID=261450 RepID=A0A835H013_9MAGN|nr:hypothetical protein IFM89_018324 [Coptis chinensis]